VSTDSIHSRLRYGRWAITLVENYGVVFLHCHPYDPPSTHDHHILGIMRRRWDAQRLDPGGTHGAELDEDHLVLLRVDDLLEAGLQTHEVRRRDPTEENGQLPATAEVLACFGDTTQALGMTNVVGDDVGFH
jgi:hypothetical protein